MERYNVLEGMVFGKAMTTPSVDSWVTVTLPRKHRTAPPGGKRFQRLLATNWCRSATKP